MRSRLSGPSFAVILAKKSQLRPPRVLRPYHPSLMHVLTVHARAFATEAAADCAVERHRSAGLGPGQLSASAVSLRASRPACKSPTRRGRRARRFMSVCLYPRTPPGVHPTQFFILGRFPTAPGPESGPRGPENCQKPPPTSNPEPRRKNRRCIEILWEPLGASEGLQRHPKASENHRKPFDEKSTKHRCHRR